MGRYYNLRETFSRSMEISPTSSPYVEKESLGKTYKSKWINTTGSGNSSSLNFRTKNGYLYPIQLGGSEAYGGGISSNLGTFIGQGNSGSISVPEKDLLRSMFNASFHHDVSFSPGYGSLPFWDTKQKFLLNKSFSLNQIINSISTQTMMPKIVGAIYIISNVIFVPLLDGVLLGFDTPFGASFPGTSPGLFTFGNKDRYVSLHYSNIGYVGTNDYKKYYATLHINFSLFENLTGGFKVSNDMDGTASKTKILSQIKSSDGKFIGGIRLIYTEDVTNILKAEADQRGDSNMIFQGGESSYAVNADALGYEPVPKVATRIDNRKTQISFSNPLAKSSYGLQTSSSLNIISVPSMQSSLPVYIDYPRIYEINAWQGPSSGWNVGRI